VDQSGTSRNFSVQDHCKLNILQLVPKTSMKVMLRGGPERWGQGSEFIERHEVVSSQGADVEDMHVSHLTSGGGRVYDLYCGSIGNYVSIICQSLNGPHLL
jgi:nuclear pore complex protein Nup210